MIMADAEDEEDADDDDNHDVYNKMTTTRQTSVANDAQSRPERIKRYCNSAGLRLQRLRTRPKILIEEERRLKQSFSGGGKPAL